MYHLLLSRQTGTISDLDPNAITLTLSQILAQIDRLKIIGAVLLTLTLLSVALRFYVRLGINRIFAREDWAMVVAAAMAVTQLALCFVSANVAEPVVRGMGTSAQVDTLQAVSRGIGIFYILTIIATKISLGCFFLNIFSHKKVQRYVIYAILALSTISGIIYTPLGYGSCAVVKEFPGLTTTCPVQQAANIFLGIFSIVNIVGDFVLAGMAIGALAVVRLPLATRASASLLILLGSAGGVAMAIRLGFTWKRSDPAQYTQELLLLTMLQQVELTTGIVSVNLAMIRPLFNKLMVALGIMSVFSLSNSKRTGVTGTTGIQKSLAHKTHNTYGDPNGEELLLDEIKRDVTVTVEIRGGPAPKETFGEV